MAAHAADAAAPAVEPAAAEADGDLPFEWAFEWRGWDGLHFLASQRTGAPDELTGRRFVDLERVQVRGRVGARLDLDAATFGGPVLDGVAGGTDVRRARINVRGDSLFIVPFDFRLEFGYVPTKLVLNEASVSWHGSDVLGTVTFGQLQPPAGLELIDSSWNLTFMEPAPPLQALLPGTEFGLRAGRAFADERGTWALALFTNGVGTSEFGNASLSDAGNAAGRLTWLAVDERTAGGVPRLLHLGASATVQFANVDDLRYRARPGSAQAPFVIDTGAIDAERASTLALEAAWIDGPLSVQAEWLHTTVEPVGGGTLHFGGGYALVSWFVTGETRGYDRRRGVFTRLRPHHDFGFGADGGPGAVQFALRLSQTDLGDGPVRGGRLRMASAGVNWTLTTNLHGKLDLMLGRVDDSANDGRLAVLQARFGLDF